MNEFLRPSFFIIGEQKCGTSSLYRYLVAHPHVLPCQQKEPQFFSQEEAIVEKEIEKYRALFPTRQHEGDLSFIWPELSKKGRIYHLEVKKKRLPNQHYISGEASANTFREVPPSRLKKYVPDAKLILLLRNPVERAFSSHRMHQRFQEEGRKQGFRVNNFATDIADELAGIHHRYLATGRYIDFLPAWVQEFGWAKLRVLVTEELGNPEQAPLLMAQLLEFLELPPFDYGNLLQKRFNQAGRAEMPHEIRQTLQTYFQPSNQALAEFLQRDLPW